MIEAATLVDGPTTTLLEPVMMPPPSESTSELNHTVNPSYWAPCSSM